MKYWVFLLAIFAFAIHAEEVFYFGDSHSTNTNLGRRVEAFLQNPASSCSRATTGTHQVRKLNGVGLDPRHWVSSSSSARNYLYRQLEQSAQVTHAAAGVSGLTQLVRDHGADNSNRRLVLEFGDNSTGQGMWRGFKDNILRMRDQLGVSARNCLVIAPQPHIKPQLREGKREVLKQLRELNESGECQVVFYDEGSSGPLPLTDGIHLTGAGYNKWADQAIAGICQSRLFAREQDVVQGCESCMEGMPTAGELPFEGVLRNLR